MKFKVFLEQFPSTNMMENMLRTKISKIGKVQILVMPKKPKNVNFIQEMQNKSSFNVKRILIFLSESQLENFWIRRMLPSKD